MLRELPYERGQALEYARRWALGRNPLFYNFTGQGGDCTNFISQCLLAGCLVMNCRETFGWYYHSPRQRAPAWTGVQYLWNFLSGNAGAGPYGREAELAELVTGDLVQLGGEDGRYYHTLFICGRRGGELLIAAHSFDAFERPLSSYDYARLRPCRQAAFRRSDLAHVVEARGRAALVEAELPAARGARAPHAVGVEPAPVRKGEGDVYLIRERPCFARFQVYAAQLSLVPALPDAIGPAPGGAERHERAVQHAAVVGGEAEIARVPAPRVHERRDEAVWLRSQQDLAQAQALGHEVFAVFEQLRLVLAESEAALSDAVRRRGLFASKSPGQTEQLRALAGRVGEAAVVFV